MMTLSDSLRGRKQQHGLKNTSSKYLDCILIVKRPVVCKVSNFRIFKFNS